MNPIASLRVALCSLLSLGVVAPAAGCEVPRTAREAGAREIRAYARAQGKQVLTFVGYSGAGYEDPAALLEAAGRVLDAHDPATTLVNIGATAAGIGAVYALARERGFATMGIVSTLARDEQVPLAPCVEAVFYVRDTTWGGRLPGSTRLSPTSAAIVAASRELVGLGGGDVARDELLEARRRGRRVSFVAFDMDHRLAIAKAQARGVPVDDFKGSAHAAFAAPR